MRAKTMLVALLLVSAAAAPVLAAPADVRSAVAAAAGRTPDNVKLDESRKPAEVLAFLGLERGMHAIDLFGGNGYWAEIMAPAVGPKGRVTVWEPTQFADEKGRAAFAAGAGRNKNVSLLTSAFDAPSLAANSYDFAMINLNYHDLYWESSKYGIKRMEPAAWLKTLYAAMKPGGIVAVIDHAAAAGSDTREVVDKLHRIDPAVVKADFAKAGFKLEAESDLLRNPADDHSKLVFDPAIRGQTDRFVLKFRKPKG
jgi:predicted methyltransferase